MKRQWRKAELTLSSPESRKPVPIVAVGAAATRGLGEGRLIPHLILDTSDRPDIEILVEAQADLPPGDVEIKWGRVSRSKRKFALILQQERPSSVLIIIEFDIADQGAVIESILNARALCIVPGREGDRSTVALNKTRMLIEVPDTNVRNEWHRIWRKELIKIFRKRGLSRGEASKAAQAMISEVGKLGKLRVWKDDTD